MKVNLRMLNNTLWQYIILYLLFITHGAVLFERYLNTQVGILLLLALTLSIMLIKRIPITRNFFFLSIGLLLSFLLVALFNQDNLRLTFMLFILVKFLMVYVAYKFNETLFFIRYLKLVLFFSVVSLIGFTLWTFAPEVLLGMLKSEYQWTTKKIYHGLLWYVVDPIKPRNIGIFYEPGVFQVPLVSCLYCLLFLENRIQISERFRNISILILLLTIVTTQSTTAYIGVTILILGYLLKRSSDNKTKKRILFIITLFLSYIISDFYIKGSDSLLQLILFDKFMGINMYESEVSSGGARVASILIALKCLSINPFGVGYTTWDNFELLQYGTTSIATGAIFFKILGGYGILTLTLLLYYIFSPVYKHRITNIGFFVFVLMYMNVTLAQSQIAYVSFLIIGMLGKASYQKILWGIKNK